MFWKHLRQKKESQIRKHARVDVAADSVYVACTIPSTNIVMWHGDRGSDNMQQRFARRDMDSLRGEFEKKGQIRVLATFGSTTLFATFREALKG